MTTMVSTQDGETVEIGPSEESLGRERMRFRELLGV
jgi:hypothetical protein